MQIDSFTVLLFALSIKLVLGGLFAVYWLKNRTSSWFIWWGAALALGSVTAALFMLRTTIENYLTLGVGNAFMLTAVACTWQGARTFEKRQAQWLPVLAAPGFFTPAEASYGCGGRGGTGTRTTVRGPRRRRRSS